METELILATMYGNSYHTENVKQTWGIFSSREAAEAEAKAQGYTKQEERAFGYKDEWVSDCGDYAIYFKPIYLNEVCCDL